MSSKTSSAKELSPAAKSKLLQILEQRFEKNKPRHKGITWSQVLTRIEKKSAKLWSLNEMEESGGEPDVVGLNKKTGEIVFVDCSEESPKGRRSLCYDREALNERKEAKPKSSAQDMAGSMGISILTEDDYANLQKLGEFDLKTSSWLNTPEAIRNLGGAIFGDRRYDHVFTYHNGAQSYYAARGFRGKLTI